MENNTNILTEKEIEILIEWATERFNIDFDLYDFNAEIDRTLTLDENKTILRNKLKNLFTEGTNLKELKQQDEKYKVLELQQVHNHNKEQEFFNKQTLEKVQTIAIYGDTGAGKTALSYKLLSALSHRDIYFIKHPKPETIKAMGYNNLRSLEELERLQDCVLYWDEPQLSVNIYDKKSNIVIAKVCSLARQRNIILIMSSSDTRVFTRHNEAYIDLWLIKDLDYSMIKRGSKIQKIVRDNTFIDPHGFKLSKNEFISESRKISELNGKHTFKLIDGWNDSLSKPFNILN
jgi:hypothetical protein